MLKIDCTGLTLREGKELATFLKAMNGVGEVRLDLDLTGMQYRSGPMAFIPHFYLLVRMAEAGGAIAGGGLVVAAGKGAAEELGKDIYKALKEWMGRFSDRSIAPVEVKLYGPDGRLIEKIEKTR
jgi:hypothetical protein